MSDTLTTEKKWKPTTAQREILEEFAALVEQEKSQAEFQRKHCSFSITKLGLILSGDYFDTVANPDAIVRELEEIIEKVVADNLRAERVEEVNIHPVTHLRAIAQAVREVKNKKGPERLVKFLSPTGGGKTVVGNYLQEEFGARVVEAREAWKRSYYIFLADICGPNGLRIRLDGECNPAHIEQKIIRSLKGKNLVLVMDEAEFFGAAALNGIKLLLNKTRLAIVICAIPEAHDRWNSRKGTRMEAEQIARRTHAIVELTSIKPADAGMFFKKGTFTSDEEAHKYIAAYASNFGHYSFINRLAQKLDGDRGLDKETVEKACIAVRRQMLKDDVVAGK